MIIINFKLQILDMGFLIKVNINNNLESKI